MNDYIIKGTDVKFKVDLSASGFDMDSCVFFFTIYCGGKTLTVLKSELVYDGTDWYLCLDTSGFNSGTITITTKAFIPDADFPDGLRTEIDKRTLGILKNE